MARTLSNSSLRSRLLFSSPYSWNLLSKSQSRSLETLAYEEIPSSESPFNSTAFVLHGLLGSGRNWRTFSRNLDSELKKLNSSDEWRMVLVDLRNHGNSAAIKGLDPPHDMVNAAKDLANLVKSRGWVWPDVVIGHSMGGKVALEYAASCARGDYGESAVLPKQGFRKIVADRWEFANEFFRKGEKHLLSEIHRRKNSQVPQQYYHQQLNQQQYYTNSPPSFYCGHQDEITTNWVDSPLPSPNSNGDNADFLSALSEDNQRLRRRNSFLLSELTHMKKLYNDIIYFLQNHVSPVPSSDDQRVAAHPRVGRLTDMGPSQQQQCYRNRATSSNGTSLKLMEESESAVKLFGVPLHGKKRLHHECESLEQ